MVANNIYKGPHPRWYPEGIWNTRKIVEGLNTHGNAPSDYTTKKKGAGGVVTLCMALTFAH